MSSTVTQSNTSLFSQMESQIRTTNPDTWIVAGGHVVVPFEHGASFTAFRGVRYETRSRSIFPPGSTTVTIPVFRGSYAKDGHTQELETSDAQRMFSVFESLSDAHAKKVDSEFALKMAELPKRMFDKDRKLALPWEISQPNHYHGRFPSFSLADGLFTYSLLRETKERFGHLITIDSLKVTRRCGIKEFCTEDSGPQASLLYLALMVGHPVFNS